MNKILIIDDDYNQNFIHGVVPFLVLSGHQAASPQF